MQSVVGVFTSCAAADKAVREILQQGIPPQSLIFLTSEQLPPVNARDSCSSAGDRPLCSWIDMERSSFSKAISLGQGAALFSLGNASLTGSGILCVVRRATQG